MKDAQIEADRVQTELLKLEEAASILAKAEKTIMKLQTSVATLKCDGDKFRRWWLTEYYSLKVVLELVPNREDVETIASASHARFSTYSK